MSADRPYQNLGIQELGGVVKQAAASRDRPTLEAVAHELSFRKSKKATALYQQITGGLGAQNPSVPAPAPEPTEPRPAPEDPPLCPICKVPMTLRTAKKGQNAGHQFWGCTDWPSCEGTRSLALAEKEGVEGPRHSSDVASGSVTSKTPDYPLVYMAEAHEKGYQVEAFESLALPEEAVSLINLADIEGTVVRSFAGWRLDFPLPASIRPLGADQTVVALAKDLLLRGTTPLAMPEMEAAVRARHGVDWSALSASAVSEALFSQASYPPSPHVPGAFDSTEERILVTWIREEVGKHRSGWSVQTQVHVASLARGMPEASRCDVLLTHPDGSRVVVELDGQQHLQHADADQAYSKELTSAGFEVVRITTGELRLRSGEAWDRLASLVQRGGRPNSFGPPQAALQEYRVLHQLQVTAIRAVLSGHLPLRTTWRIQVQASIDLSVDLVTLALNQVREVLHRLAGIWDVDAIPHLPAEIEVLPSEHVPGTGPIEFICPESDARYFISDVVLPTRPLQLPMWGSPLRVSDSLKSSDGEWFLRWIFGKEAFWEGQWDCISRALQGRDTLVLLPTGRGKSIAFQLAALLRPGPCLVVDPIISLMDDQIDNLRTVGMDRTVGISGRQTSQEKDHLLGGFASGHFNFCYVSPERFQSVPFRETLRGLTVNSPVSLIAIDEAHCVSEWGHDFRTAYLNLGRTTRDYCTRGGEPAPPLVGLTGTASRVVLKDVQRALGIQGVDAIVTPSSFDRPELTFGVVSCRSSEKSARLTGLVQGMPQRFGMVQGSFFAKGAKSGGAGLVFCPHVNGPFGTFDVARELSSSLGLPVDMYSGSAPKRASGDWEGYKMRVARDFKRDRVNLLACTKAFGMGIDKANIRFTIHYGLPQTVESFYQEAGRAGRDQCQAHCDLVLSLDHPQRARQLLDPNTTVEKVGQVLEGVGWSEADDVTRALFFHTRAFLGIEQDLEMVRCVLDRLGTIRPDQSVAFGWRGLSQGKHQGDSEKQASEKALHHLVTLGVIKDYTLDWAKCEFQVVLGDHDVRTIASALGDYGRSYQVRRGDRLQRQFEEEATADPIERIAVGARLLVEFIYETVELARRRGLREMLQAATEAATDSNGSELLKQRILVYLNQTDWDVRLEEIAGFGGLEVEALRFVLEEVVSSRHAEELRGATARQLSSYPDQPAFLFLRAFAEACVADPDWENVTEDVRAAMEFGRTKYGSSDEVLSTVVADLASIIESRGRDGVPFVRGAIATPTASRSLQRQLCSLLPEHLAVEAIDPLMTRLRREAAADSSPHDSDI